MFRKLRYAAAILCGSAIVSAAFLSSCRAATTDLDSDTQTLTAEGEGSTGSGIQKEEDGSSEDEDPGIDSAADGSVEETGTSAGESGEETEEESSPEETEEETAEETTEEETTEEETTEDPASMVGLRKYFQNRLVVNAEKVELYLNVREEPDDDSRILSVLYPNDIAKYVGKSGNWYEIEREGYTGFVNASYVLTDKKAYDTMVHTVAYAAMVQIYESYLYAVPDTSTEIILCAHKSDAFRLKGISGGFYEVEVVSDLYDTLFMPMDDAIIFYLFLGQGNSNELGEREESFFGTLEVAENLERSEELIEEYAEDLKEYQDYLASSEAESWAAEQAYIAASRKAQQDAAEAARQQVSSAAEAAQASGEDQYLGRFYITHYCHCQQCCGIWGSNDPNYEAHGSSGMRLQSDYTVAVNTGQIPYGTRLRINGKEYVAADTGVGPGVIDVYRQTHEYALSGGAYYADVYLIP